jgi:Holliday junction DNA helicase RuvA
MITFLEGILVEALPNQIVINVHGIGYQVYIPLSSFDRLPFPGQPIRILTHLSIREDAHILYGFLSTVERDLFRLLVQHVTGVGPKLALSILSGMSVDAFKAAVIHSDLAAISRVSGVGKKTAERVILELKDKLGVAAEWEAASHAHTSADAAASDAVLALISLGYKQSDAHKAVRQTQAKLGGPVLPEELVRQALKHLL